MYDYVDVLLEGCGFVYIGLFKVIFDGLLGIRMVVCFYVYFGDLVNFGVFMVLLEELMVLMMMVIGVGLVVVVYVIGDWVFIFVFDVFIMIGVVGFIEYV